MARGKKKSIEEKINEKEELISSLQTRIKSEQRELEELNKEKKIADLESLNNLLEASGLSVNEAEEALKNFSLLKNENVS